MTYAHTWLNECLTTGATTTEEMVEMLQAATDKLRAMQAAGVTLTGVVGYHDDIVVFHTDDPAVADQFEFRAMGGRPSPRPDLLDKHSAPCVTVRVGDEEWKSYPEIAALSKELYRAKIRTVEEWPLSPEGYFTLKFATVNALLRFLNIVVVAEDEPIYSGVFHGHLACREPGRQHHYWAFDYRLDDLGIAPFWPPNDHWEGENEPDATLEDGSVYFACRVTVCIPNTDYPTVLSRLIGFNDQREVKAERRLR